MDSGYYATSAGLRAQSQALEVAAHNLANVSTTGFRGEKTTFESLLALPRAAGASPINAAIISTINATTNNYGVLEGTHLDLSEGSFTSTGNPLDVAIQGAGFFVVKTATGTRYTRDGSFQISSAGELVTAAGDPVQGDTGAIRIPAGAVAIGADGTVSVGGTVAGRLRLVEFPSGTKLSTEGGTLISAPAGTEKAAQASSVREGMLESSNVSAIGSMVGLIEVQRQAEMLSRAMNMFDTEFNHIAASQLAKVG